AKAYGYQVPSTTSVSDPLFPQWLCNVNLPAGLVTMGCGGTPPPPAGTATDCTLFASASGNDNNSGTSTSAPKTLSGAAALTQPGSVVCIMGGTYNLSSTFAPPKSG